MPSRPTAHPEAIALAREAAALDARGANAEAIDAWSRAAQRDPAFAPAQLGLAQALVRAGRAADALRLLTTITRRAPNVAAAWLAQAVASSLLGHHDDAVAAAERAVALAPRLPAVHLGAGDVLRQAGRLDDAAVAYRAALALAPDDAEVLNKTASMLRLGHRPDEAEALLRRALARAPAHPYARVNLATLMVERARPEGPALLREAGRASDLPTDARNEVDEALANLAERETLAAPLAAALARNDPAPLAEALRARPVANEPDVDLVAVLAALAERMRASPPIDERLPAGAPRSAVWPALEAHHNFPGPRSDEAIASTVRLVAVPEAARTDTELDRVRYAQAVADPAIGAIDPSDPHAFEAWLRLRHAQLVGHRPDHAPGQWKLLNNVVASAPLVVRTPTRRLRATLRAIVVDLAPRVPPGAWRAVFLYVALLESHPFADANGRLARLLLNRLLLAAGRFPHLRADGKDSAALTSVRADGDPESFAAWLAANCRYAVALDARWSAGVPA